LGQREFTNRRKQEIESLDSWDLTKKLDLRAFQTLENDERRGTLTLEILKGAGSDVISDTK